MGETELELVHRHERSDVAPRWPVLIGAGMLLLLPIGVAVTALLLNTLWAEPPARPSPFPQETRGTAVPRLQVQPEIELDTLRAAWQERLHSYGWIDRDQQLVHVPIDVAMQRLVQQSEQAGQAESQQDNEEGDE